MKIVHLCASAFSGGAANAARRVHEGMLQIGADSSLLAIDVEEEDTKKKIFPHRLSQVKREINGFLNQLFIHNNRTSISSTHFSHGFVEVRWAENPLVGEADVLQIHWMGEMITPLDIVRLRETGKIIVLFLHDFRHFTGGCHFPSGCERFKCGCGDCPQLKNDRFTGLYHSLNAMACENLPIVASNRWLLEIAKTNCAFQESSGCVAPDDLPPSIYHPGDQLACRKNLGLPVDHFVMLLGAAAIDDRRKGIGLLLENIKRYADKFRTSGRKITLALVGHPIELNETELPVGMVQLGYQKSENNLVECYRASDVLLLPSSEDNSPLMALGAMACGVPVVSFAVGGIPELLAGSGIVCEYGDWERLIDEILKIAVDQSLHDHLSQLCVKHFADNHQSPSQARKCLSFLEKQARLEYNNNDRSAFFNVYSELGEMMKLEIGINLARSEQGKISLQGGIDWRDSLSLVKNPAACLSRIGKMIAKSF